MILKAGTYRFNDVLTSPINNITTQEEFNTYLSGGYAVPFIFSDYSFDYTHIRYVKANGSFIVDGVDVVCDNFEELFYAINPENNNGRGVYVKGSVTMGGQVNSGDGWEYLVFGGDIQTHTILEQEVDETFGTWYIANTNYNEVNATPLVTIEYNGSTIAELNAGETATLSCEGKKMVSDVVVKVNGGSSSGASAYTVSSVDELPSNAVDGSMAIVQSIGYVGDYWLNAVVEPVPNPIELEFIAYNSYYGDTVFMAMEMMGTIGNGRTLCYSFEIGDESEPVFNDDESRWHDGDSFRNIRVLKEPTDEIAKAWLTVNGKKLIEVYIRENGEWVYKCEVV